MKGSHGLCVESEIGDQDIHHRQGTRPILISPVLQMGSWGVTLIENAPKIPREGLGHGSGVEHLSRILLVKDRGVKWGNLLGPGWLPPTPHLTASTLKSTKQTNGQKQKMFCMWGGFWLPPPGGG